MHPNQGSLSQMMIKLALLLITLLSFLVHGYNFATGDQSTYVPQVLKRVNPNLYTKDYLSQTAEGDLSFMFPLMAGVLKTTGIDIEWLYFFLYLFFRWLVIVALYKLGLSLTGGKKAALVATIILSLPKFVGGTNNPTLDSAWIPRFFVLPLLLWGLDCLVHRRYLLATFLTGITFTLHPYSGVYLGLFLFACFLTSGRFWSLIPKAILIAVIASGWFVISLIPAYLSRSSQLFMDHVWFDIVSVRLPYNLISNWGLGALIALILPLLGYLVFPHRLLRLSLITAAIITLIHVVFGEIFKVALIFQLQLPRIWLIPTYMGYIGLSFWLVKIWSRSLLTKLIVILVAVVLLTNFGRFSPGSIDWPHHYQREWDKLQVWVRHNTPEDALLITPATRIGFRIRSERSIVAEIKDGSSGLYSPSLARNWQERVSDLGLINIKTAAEIEFLQQKYHADYLVTFSNARYPQFQPVFNTESFIVYKL
ncbi:MAG: hypothetical protein HYS86_04955 [Candidatus Chisholmbacteria bacterium]|nr:hypothetical protein [Candidatus Chisholmbacteria bacterium]